jgi:hypothetical protein
MPGSGCMTWRWETKDPPPSEEPRKGSPEPRKGLPPLEPPKGYCGLAARPSRSLRSDEYRALRGAGMVPKFRH